MTDEAQRSEHLAGLRARAIDGALKLGARTFAIRALGLIGTVVLARFLEPDDFGLLALGFSVQLFGNVLAGGGLGAELVRRKAPPTMPELRSVLGYQLLAGFVLAVLVALVAVLVGGPADFLALVALAIPINALNTPTWIVLSRRLEWDPMAYSDVAATIAFNVVAIALVVVGMGVWGAAIGIVVQTIVAVSMLNRLGPVGLCRPSFSLAAIRPLLRFGIAFQSQELIDRGRDPVVNFMIAGVGGLALLGVWSAAYRILLSISLIFEALRQVSFPAMARMLEVGHDPHRMIENVLRLNATAFGFPAAAVAGTAPALVPVLFGTGFDGAVSVLPWGAAALLLSGPVITAGMSFIKARGDSRGMIGSYLLQTAVWLAVGAVLMGPLGAQGLGIAMFVAAFALVVAIRAATRRYAEVDYVGALWPPAVAACLGAAVAWPIANAFSSHVVGLLLAGAASQAVYLGVLIVIRRSDVDNFFGVLLGAVRGLVPAGDSTAVHVDGAGAKAAGGH
jgi:O-antigen/teichoic acid export membrane protein